MATTPVTQKKRELEAHERPSYRRLGAINGTLIGLALALGAWVGEGIALAQLPIRQQHPSLILGGFLLILICTFAGWLTSRWAKTGLTLFLWLVAAFLSTLIITYQPSIGRNLVAWLSDNRFWGLPVYPGLEAPFYAILLAGFAIFLAQGLLAVIQAYRLEGAQRELGDNGRMSGRSWLILLWPLIFVALAGWITNNIAGDKAARDALLVKEAIDTGRTYDGDLRQLGLERGVNYGAISTVREQMSPTYTLLIGGVDADTLSTFVVAHFVNGAWINCRVINGQLNFCYDAAPPYTLGLASLINWEELPDNCGNCRPRVGEGLAAWLRGQNDMLGENPEIIRLAQMGGYVLMRVTAESGDQAIDCWFKSISPVQLESCALVTP